MPDVALTATILRHLVGRLPGSPGKHKLNSIDVLTDFFIPRGLPPCIRSNNDPEFVAKADGKWIKAVGVKTAYFEPESPWKRLYQELQC